MTTESQGPHEHVFRCQDCDAIATPNTDAQAGYIDGYSEGHEEGFQTGIKAAMDAVGKLLIPRDPNAYMGTEASDDSTGADEASADDGIDGGGH